MSILLEALGDDHSRHYRLVHGRAQARPVATSVPDPQADPPLATRGWKRTPQNSTNELAKRAQPCLVCSLRKQHYLRALFRVAPDAPSVIRSFLSKHDLSGKALVPFITHGGFGLGQSLRVIAEQSPQAQLLEGFFLEADQERRTLEQVTSWLGGVQITR